MTQFVGQYARELCLIKCFDRRRRHHDEMTPTCECIERIGFDNRQHEATFGEFVAAHDGLPGRLQDGRLVSGGLACANEAYEHESLNGTGEQQDEERKERANEQPVVHVTPSP